MRWLIDGYNVMYAGGRLGPNLARQAFRRARRRFLDELAETIGPEAALHTTIVFDARVHPGDFETESAYRGISVLFALGDENADARIEALIAAHSSPKALTVVSSDNRIKLAASRRRCRCLSAEAFWELLDDLKEARARKKPARQKHAAAAGSIPPESSHDELSHWLTVFGELDSSPEVRQVTAGRQTLLTDAEIEELKRHIERES
jgi:uncharacterized protein